MRCLSLTLLAALLAGLVAPAAARAQRCIASSGATIAEWCYRTDGLRTALAISRDDGLTWQDTGLEVDDVAVHDAATVVALVDAPSPHLVIFEAAGRRAIPLPFERALGVRSAGGRLFVLGERPSDADPSGVAVGIVVTDDLGAPLREAATLPFFASLAGASADAHGPSLEVWSAEGLSCFGTVIERRYRLSASTLASSVLRDDTECANVGRHCSNFVVVGLGAHGSVYGLRGQGESSALVQVVSSGRLARTGLTTAEGVAMVDTNGRITLAIVDRALVRLEGARAIVLSDGVPEGAESLHVDARGRAWVLAHGGIRRFTRADGFTLVRADP